MKSIAADLFHFGRQWMAISGQIGTISFPLLVIDF